MALFGTRWNLRRHFEVDRAAIAYTALVSLVAEDKLPAKTAKEAAKKYKINIDASNPLGVWCLFANLIEKFIIF